MRRLADRVHRLERSAVAARHAQVCKRCGGAGMPGVELRLDGCAVEPTGCPACRKVSGRKIIIGDRRRAGNGA